MRSLFSAALQLSLFAFACAQPQHLDTCNNVTIWQPPKSWPDRSTSYARATLLMQEHKGGTPSILATWSGSGPSGPYFQIMESDDGGRSWYEISKAYFTHGNETGGSF